MFRRGIWAELPYLAVGPDFCAAFRREARGLKEDRKVRLTCQLGELCDIYGKCHKPFAGTDVMIWLPCLGTGRGSGYGVGNARDDRNEML